MPGLDGVSICRKLLKKNQSKEILKDKVNLLRKLLNEEVIDKNDLKEILSHSKLLEKEYFKRSLTTI